MPFSPQTIDFLTMNRLNDSKLWFNEHKDDYRRFVAEPFREFTEKLLPEMQKIDPLINSVRISRIYRDARYYGESRFSGRICGVLSAVQGSFITPCHAFILISRQTALSTAADFTSLHVRPWMQCVR